MVYKVEEVFMCSTRKSHLMREAPSPESTSDAKKGAPNPNIAAHNSATMPEPTATATV